MTDDDDFLDLDEDDTKPDPARHGGALSVPGIAKSEAEFLASAAGYRAGRPVLFVDHDAEKNEIWIGNLAELRAAGFTESTIAQAEKWLAPPKTNQ